MEIRKEKIDDLNMVLYIGISKSDYEPKVEESLKNFRKKADIKGFRKGMVPMGMVKKLYGKAVLADEVQKMITDELIRFLNEEKLNILGEPLPSLSQKEIDWDNDSSFEFAYDLGLAPEVHPVFTEEDTVPYYFIKVDEDMISKRIAHYQQSYGDYSLVEEINPQTRVTGDFTELDPNGTPKTGGIFVEKASFLMSLIKDEGTIQSVAGKKAGEEVVLSVRQAFPNETDLSSMLKIDKKDLSSLAETFRLQITEVSEFIPAELNETLFSRIYPGEEIHTEEDFRKMIMGEIAKDLLMESEYRYVIDLKEFLLKKFDLRLPVDFLKRWLSLTNKELTTEQIEKEWSDFEKDLTWQIIKDKIAETKEIKVEKEDLMDMARKVTIGQFRQYGISYLPDEELDRFAAMLLEKEDQRRKMYESKRDEMIHEALKGMLKLDEKEVSVEAFNDLFKTAPTA